MSKKKKVYTNGERLQVYINQKVDQNILDFINKQSDISSAAMLGYVILYQMFGDVDIVDHLPRTFTANTVVPNFTSQGNSLVRNVVNNIPSPSPIISASVSGIKNDAEALDNDVEITSKQPEIATEEVQLPTSPSTLTDTNMSSLENDEVNEEEEKNSAPKLMGNMGHIARALNNRKN